MTHEPRTRLLAGPDDCVGCLSDLAERRRLRHPDALCSEGYCEPCHRIDQSCAAAHAADIERRCDDCWGTPAPWLYWGRGMVALWLCVTCYRQRMDEHNT